jgi:glycosyltransferase involved in cell wall biosynthesis
MDTFAKPLDKPGRGRIVVVSPYVAEYGPSRTLGHVVRALAEAGFEPVCVVPPAAASETDRVVEDLGTVPRTLNPLRLAAFLRAHRRATKEIERIARETRAVMVYSASEAIFCGALAARRIGVPSVVHVLGMSIGSPRRLARIYIPFLSRRTDRFIAISTAVADMLAASGVPEARIAVVPNGASGRAIDEAAALQPPVAPNGPLVGMIAAFDARKGHELFVEAASLIAARHPDARFAIVGGRLEGQPASAAFEAEIGRLIERLGLVHRFDRPGFVGHPELYAWIRAMDVVVVPSRTEAGGPSFALLEAMFCGRAIVATALEGNLDAFVDGVSGRYAGQTATAMSGVIGELLEDAAQRKALGAAARDRAYELFDLEVVLPALAEAVADLLPRTIAS